MLQRMKMRLKVASIPALLATVAIGAGPLIASSHPQRAHATRHHARIGHSVQARALTAVRLGNPNAKRTALIVGQIHGDEPVGREVIRALRHLHRGFHRVAIWTVLTVNPDGNRLDTRKNAHGVDLNRNFSYHWSNAQPPSSGYYGGPSPFSEPESRAVRRLAKRIRPNLTIWYHQPWNAVLACGGGHRIESRYAEIADMRVLCRGARGSRASRLAGRSTTSAAPRSSSSSPRARSRARPRSATPGPPPTWPRGARIRPC